MADEQKVEQPDEGSTEVPEWVPEKFRSNPEEFGRSYGELEAKLTQTTQQLRSQQEQLEQHLANEQQPEEPADNFLQASQDQLYAAYEQDPVATMAWLANQAAQSVWTQNQRGQEPDPAALETQAALAGKYAEDQITARYSDFDDYREKVAEEINSNPDLYPDDLFKTPAGIEKALTRAYKSVRLDTLEANTNATVEEQIAAQRREKQQAQTLSGASGRPAPTDSWEDRWAEINAASPVSARDILGG